MRLELIICRLPGSNFSLLAQTVLAVARVHTYIHTQIHSDSKETEAPLFYYYMFICASFGSKISGFQKYECYAIMTNPHFT